MKNKRKQKKKQKFQADIREHGFTGQNCFLRVAEGDKHVTMMYLHFIDKNLCKRKDKYGNTALTVTSKFVSKENSGVIDQRILR